MIVSFLYPEPVNIVALFLKLVTSQALELNETLKALKNEVIIKESQSPTGKKIICLKPLIPVYD